MDKPAQEAEVIEPTAQDFQKEYEALCKKMGMVIIPTLAYIKRDDGTFSTVCNLTVGKLPKGE